MSNVLDISNTGPTLVTMLTGVNLGTRAVPVPALVITQLDEETGGEERIVVPGTDVAGLIELMKKYIEAPA